MQKGEAYEKNTRFVMCVFTFSMGESENTCTACHNRGKRIGVSYQGLMMTGYQATFDAQEYCQ